MASLGLALSVGLIAAAPAGATPSQPTCGQTLTASVVLHANLDCSAYTSGPALTIGAAGIIVNLNRESIIGPGQSANTTGVSDLGFGKLTLRNGTVTNFAADVDIEGVTSSPLAGIVVDNVTVQSPPGGSLRRNANYINLHVAYLTSPVIKNVTSVGSRLGIYLDEGSTGAVVRNNSVSNTIFGTEDIGSGNLWSNNNVVNTSFYGMAFFTSGAVVRSNLISGAGTYGIYDAFSTSNTFRDNTINKAPTGVYEFVGTNIVWTGNVVVPTNDGTGFYSVRSSNLTFKYNVANGGADGFFLAETNSVTLLSNEANHNTDDGIYVENNQPDLPSTLSGNVASHNGNAGLYAVNPTLGSNNEAHGNTVINCFNVTC